MHTQLITMLSADELKKIIKDSFKEEMISYFSENVQKPNKDMLSMKDLCHKLGVSKPTIIKWTKEGRLIGHQMGRRILYNYEEVEKCLGIGEVNSSIAGLKYQNRWKNSL